MSIRATESFFQYFSIKSKAPELSIFTEILRGFSYIPYENISKIITADNRSSGYLRKPETVIEEFISSGLGGTCFSLTYCLKRILDDAGLSSELLLADRNYGENTHCCISVNIGNKKYIADIGYLIFQPIKAPETGETEFFQYGKNIFSLESDTKNKNIIVSTIFANGHKKFRYRIKTLPATKEEFFYAWEKSFNSDMMKTVLINRYIDGNLIYIKNNIVHINSIKQPPCSRKGLLRYIETLGISPQRAKQAFSILNIQEGY